MNDHKYIQFCLSQIEKKLGWGKSDSWKESEFIGLSEIIFKETEISISPHTLKRLYGKIKYKEHYNPQRATKDALAKFTGHTNWIAFINYYDRENGSEPGKIYFWKNKKIKIGLLISLGLMMLLFLPQWTGVMNAFVKNEQKSSYSFNTIDTIASVPYTVSVNYSIANMASDSVYLDFDFDHPITGPEIKKLDKQRSLYNYTYQIPGYYHIKLTSENRILSGQNVLVTSEDWLSYYYPENRQILWLNNQINNINNDGYLYQSPENLMNNGFDITSVYYVDNQLFKDFGIDGDNFEMELRFKNSGETGGISCYDFVLTLLCEKDFSHFKLMEKGCSSYSGIKVGELDLNGVDQDLSSLTFDPKCWIDLNVVVKAQTVNIIINDELVLSKPYKGSNGNIVGIEQLFKGTGFLDYIRITDLGTQNSFSDDFD
ncbi:MULTISPECIES: hypothetical protein [Salegentibacter]|uniref:Uncharacterized protein n=1 Tax=Salegentibacter agarivorans TaxID=345907 RepID=A0A1I2N6F7_9FLAO|nr:MULTISPECIES: hypothetical protein [Salegentibacter]SFF97086.1 hypothetical protein SAMN04488033_11733 [Salegentibacter agarivorans]